MGPRRAGGSHDAVQPVLGDHLLDLLLASLGAEEKVPLDMDHVG
jgi:hypothetical protein